MSETTTNDRREETGYLRPGQRVWLSGFEAVVQDLYIDGPNEGSRSYNVRLARGCACVAGSELKPIGQ